MLRKILTLFSTVIVFTSCFKTNYRIALLESHEDQCQGIPYYETKRTKFGENFPLYFGGAAGVTSFAWVQSTNPGKDGRGLKIGGAVLSFIGVLYIADKFKLRNNYSINYPNSTREIENFIRKYNSTHKINIIAWESLPNTKNTFGYLEGSSDMLFKFRFAENFSYLDGLKKKDLQLAEKWVDERYLVSTPRLAYTSVMKKINVPYFGMIEEIRYRPLDGDSIEGQVYFSNRPQPYGNVICKISNNSLVGWGWIASNEYNCKTNFSTLSKNISGIKNEIIQALKHNTNSIQKLEDKGFKPESIRFYNFIHEADPIDNQLTASFTSSGNIIFKDQNGITEQLYFSLTSNDYFILDGNYVIDKVISEKEKEIAELMSNFSNTKFEKINTFIFIPEVSTSLYHPHLLRRMREYSTEKYCGTTSEEEVDYAGTRTTYTTDYYVNEKSIYFDLYKRNSIVSPWQFEETITMRYYYDCLGDLEGVSLVISDKPRQYLEKEKEAWDALTEYVYDAYPQLKDAQLEKFDSLQNLISFEAEMAKNDQKEKFNNLILNPKKEGYLKRYIDSPMFSTNPNSPYAGVWYDSKKERLFLISNLPDVYFYCLNLDTPSLSKDEFPLLAEGNLVVESDSLNFLSKDFILSNLKIKTASNNEILFQDGSRWIRQTK